MSDHFATSAAAAMIIIKTVIIHDDRSADRLTFVNARLTSFVCEISLYSSNNKNQTREYGTPTFS